jgi:hypothetical protein
VDVKPKLYLESTIPSYYVARPSKSGVAAYEQTITRLWWEKRVGDFDVYVSEVVIQEVSAGDPAMAKRRIELVKSFKELAMTDDVKTLAKALINSGPLPAKAAQDAFHIAATLPIPKCCGRLSWFAGDSDSNALLFAPLTK